MTAPQPSPTATRLDAVDEMATHLQRLARLTFSRQVANHIATAADVTVSQQGAVLLRALLHGGKQPLAKLASAAGMDLGAVSRQVRLLETAGAVQRSNDPADGRVSLLELTSQGRQMAESLRAAGVGHLVATLDGWPDNEVRTLTELLGRLVTDLVATPVPGSTGRPEGDVPPD